MFMKGNHTSLVALFCILIELGGNLILRQCTEVLSDVYRVLQNLYNLFV